MTPTPEAIVKTFRVAELKECLTKIGLTRTGRKFDQQQRILDYLHNLDQSRGGEQQRRTAGGGRAALSPAGDICV